MEAREGKTVARWCHRRSPAKGSGFGQRQRALSRCQARARAHRPHVPQNKLKKGLRASADYFADRTMLKTMRLHPLVVLGGGAGISASLKSPSSRLWAYSSVSLRQSLILEPGPQHCFVLKLQSSRHPCRKSFMGRI
jgi:hypothetical protein